MILVKIQTANIIHTNAALLLYKLGRKAGCTNEITAIILAAGAEPSAEEIGPATATDLQKVITLFLCKLNNNPGSNEDVAVVITAASLTLSEEKITALDESVDVSKYLAAYLFQAIV